MSGENRDPNARLNAGIGDAVAYIQAAGCLDGLEDLYSNLPNVVLVTDLVKQVQELVTAMAADRVGIACVVPEARRNSLQYRVAGLVTMSVVDGFEIVQINEHDGENPPMPFSLRYAVLETIPEQHAIRQPGQIVVQPCNARPLFLFLCRGKLMIDHVPIPDFDPQRPDHGGQRFRCMLQMLCHSLAILAIRMF